jgi:hypothetical protein
MSKLKELAKVSGVQGMKITKLSVFILWVSILAVSLAGCGAANSVENPAAPIDAKSTNAVANGPLQTDYENALPISSQLALGLFKLEESDTPLSPERAAALLPLWKAYRSLSSNEDASSEELNALIKQAQETLSEEQLQAIAAMHLTMQDLVELAQEKNLSLGAGGPGGGAGLSEEERATRQAQRFSGEGSSQGRGPGGMGPPGGGILIPGGEPMPGGEMPPGAMATPSVRQTAVAQRRNSGESRISPGLVEALIAYLEDKAK